GPVPPERKDVTPPPAGAPWQGTANARVVIQEWSDFQCPFCSRVETTIDEVMKNYGERVKFVWRDKPLPMHPDAALA
uniref:DsbA family protein n=1 Tax=Acinetobacter baumannii TaxID=470 RepID=UPI00148EFD28